MATVNIDIQAVASSSATSSRRALSSLRSKVIKNLGNDSDYFEDDDIDNDILDALDECAELSKEYEAVDSTTTTVDGTRTYTKPTAAIGINAVVYNDILLDKIDKKEMLALYDNNSTPEAVKGLPSAWCNWSLTQIALYPAPNEAKTLEFHYFGYPSDLGENDTSGFIRSIDKVAVNYATAEGWARDGEDGKYALYNGKYERAKARFLVNQKNYPQFWAKQEYFTDSGD